ncbi:MAG: NAD+ synthase [Firmicutes bacterium]|nr:NAD+ synthase [Bacillota bacterium]
MACLRLAAAQINPVVGDISFNKSRILEVMGEARKWKADVIIFPELAVTGYPPEDLLLKPKFIEGNQRCVYEIAASTTEHDAIVIMGFVDKQDDIFNSACIIHRGRVCGVYHKSYLPNYGVFDEERYFCAGTKPMVVKTEKASLGISICEDIWYPGGPIADETVLGGAEIIINISASPYHIGKSAQRERMLRTRAQDHAAIVAFVNMVGGQDELVFDGNSLIIDERGEIIARGKPFEEDLIMADVFTQKVFSRRLHDPRRRKARKNGNGLRDDGGLDIVILESQTADDGVKPDLPNGPGLARSDLPDHHRIPNRSGISDQHRAPDREAISCFAESSAVNLTSDVVHEAYLALSLGLRDYVRKNGFEKVVVGLSGGIDSALTATIAADALGNENVVGVSMPSRFTEDRSIKDASELAANLGIEFKVIPIEPIFNSYLESLKKIFRDLPFGVTEENLQARIRGNLLMALSNKFGWLVVTTGNKSEMSVGYATLYGDMAGGFALLKDVPKTLVYSLANYRNSMKPDPVIPGNIISRPPTAELRPNQKDTDSLPPYGLLDPIIQAYVEEDIDVPSLIDMGYPQDAVRKVVNLVARSEYKRRQAPPGVKITPRAFGRDRRFPITNHFLE